MNSINNVYEAFLLSLSQSNFQLAEEVRGSAEDNISAAKEVAALLDTNVMYDPLSGEGLVCVNGRCISNKRKFQVHDEKHLGLRGGNRRRQPAAKGKKVNPNGRQQPGNRRPMMRGGGGR